MLIIKNNFLFNLRASTKSNGKIMYTKSNPDNQKKITLLKQT